MAAIQRFNSFGHHGFRLHFDDLEGQRAYGSFRAYRQAKLAEIMFTYELARRLAGTRITANALHPGIVATRIYTRHVGVLSMLEPLMPLVMLSPEAGAATTLYLAASPEVARVTGQYFDRRKAVRSSPASYDAAAARRLWEISAEMTGLPSELSWP